MRARSRIASFPASLLLAALLAGSCNAARAAARPRDQGRPAAPAAFAQTTWHGTRTARTQDELAAASSQDTDVILCPQPFEITRTVDLRDKDIVAGPRVFRFAGEGRLLNGRSIARLSAQARYPVFVNAKPGFWVWYTGRVSFQGRRYAPLPDQDTPPSVLGAWNNQVRDITMWSQYHEGRHNEAIEAAQNSLPGKKNLADRFGTIRLPAGTLTLERPVYYTVGMRILGNRGPSGARTTLEAGPKFADPDRLYDLPENFVVVGVPQNRNNPRRVSTGPAVGVGGGGDGKSVFNASLQDLRIATNGRANGILLHASRASEIRNVAVVGGAKGYRAWVIRSSDDFKLFNTWADGKFDVGYDLIGSCLNVDIDGSRTNMGPESIGYRIQGSGRLGAVCIHNANIEGTGTPFVIHRPRGVRITSFSAQGAKAGSPVAIIGVSGLGAWPNYECILQGAATKGFDRIHLTNGQKLDVWRVKTRRIDNSGFAYDWPDAKWAGVDFNLTRELEANKGRLRIAPAKAPGR